MVRLTVLLSLFTAGSYGQLLINEVLFYPDPASQDTFGTHQWVEVYNAGRDPVDLSGWSVTGADGVNGSSARSLPPVTLPPAGYLVVHFASGQNQLDFTNNSGDFYTGDSTDSPYWNVDADEAALYSPNGIADFINWQRGPAAQTRGAAHNDAVAAGIWTSGAALIHDRIGRERLELLREVTPGDSIGRDADSTDTNQPADFDAGGGQSAFGPTPGRPNLTLALKPDAPPIPQLTHAAVRQGAAVVKKKWTVLLFMSGNNDLKGKLLGNLFRIQAAGGSTDDVNFVAMIAYEGKQAQRGLIVSDPPGEMILDLRPPENESPAIGNRNMGDPQELKGFIEWAKANFPADKYGLVLSSHGDGWKYFGPHHQGFRDINDQFDWLFMGELSTALAGQSFEWIAFEACLMAGIEVAHQLQPFAKYLLASEEVVYIGKDGDFPYEEMRRGLTARPFMDAFQCISFILSEWSKRARDREKRLNAAAKGQPVDPFTVAVIDLGRVPELSARIRAWADLLAPGMRLFQGRDDPADNVQVLTKNQLEKAERFADKNYIDLYHFAQLMQKSGIPDCLLTPVPDILDIIANRVVLYELHSEGHPNAHGLHIYFPRRRMKEPEGHIPNTGFANNGDFHNFLDQPYDLPFSRTVDGNSPLAHYGLLEDQLPLRSRNPETGRDFDQLVWPLPQSPGFKFPNDTLWRRVLDRYYHPAADNRILKGVAPDGKEIAPTQVNGGACSNPSDQITVPVGSTVFFSGSGSSDADQPSGILPSYYFWDKDDRVGCPGCMPEPQTVPPGSDPAKAVTNMDADQDIRNTTFDQKDKDGEGPKFSVICSAPGTFKVTLNPWDDDHLFAFHNTLPDASYVHPQSGQHQAQVTCTLPPPPPATCPMSGTLNVTFTVTDDPFVSATFVGLLQGILTMIRSGPQGSQVSVTGDIPQLVPAMGPFDASQCAFNLTGTSTGLIAGFPMVQAQYNLTIAGINFDKVTGTYKVGLNNTLNREPQPVTYSVTGTVTNAKQ